MTSPQTAAAVLDTWYLQIRARLLEIGASLDRIDRAAGAEQLSHDPRLDEIRQALAILNDGEPNRAERIQMVFSDPYDPQWRE